MSSSPSSSPSDAASSSSPLSPFLHIDMSCWLFATIIMFGLMFHQMYAFHRASRSLLIPPTSPQQRTNRRRRSAEVLNGGGGGGGTGTTPILNARSPSPIHLERTMRTTQGTSTDGSGGKHQSRQTMSTDLDNTNMKRRESPTISPSPILCKVRPSVELESKQVELAIASTPIIQPSTISSDPPILHQHQHQHSHIYPDLPRPAPFHESNKPPLSPSHNKYFSPRVIGPRQATAQRISVDVISPRAQTSHSNPNARTPSRPTPPARETLLPYRFHILCCILTCTLPFQLISWSENYYPPSSDATVLQIITVATAHMRTVCLAFAGMYLTYVSMDGLYVAISSTGSPRIVAWSHIAMVSTFVICSTLSCLMMFTLNRGWPDAIWCIAQTVGMIFVWSVFTYAIHIFTRQLDAQNTGIHVMSPQLITRFQRMKRAMTYVRIVLVIGIATEIYVIYGLLSDLDSSYQETSHGIMFSEWVDLIFGAWIRWYWWKKMTDRASSASTLSNTEAA